MDKEIGSVICASGILFCPNRSVRCEGTGLVASRCENDERAHKSLQDPRNAGMSLARPKKNGEEKGVPAGTYS